MKKDEVIFENRYVESKPIKLVFAIGQQVAASVSSTITRALSDSLQAVMSTAMTQMMTAIQEQVRTALEDALPQLIGQMSSAMNIDEQTFRDAFSLNISIEDRKSVV